MARRTRTTVVGERDDPLQSLIDEDVAPRPLLDPGYLSTPDEPLTEYQDRRTFNADPFGPALSIGGRPAPVVHRFSKPRVRFDAPPPRSPRRAARAHRDRLEHRLKFETPKAALVCIRRATRREVIFALGRRGRGGGKRRRNHYSNLRC